MRKIYGFWKVVVIDSLGVLFMIAALLTGWLPGPGGVPLFIIGLSLLAINHAWAKRYTLLARQYADRLGDHVFVNDVRIQVIYDVLGPVLMTVGGWLLLRHSAVWMVSLGISACLMGLTFLLGNRGRWTRLKKALKRKR